MVYYSTYLIAELGLGLVVISTTPSFGILNDSTRLLKKIKIDKVRHYENNGKHSKEDTTEPSGTFLF